MTLIDWLMIFGYFGVLAMVVVATLTAPVPESARIESLTFATLGDDFKRENRASWNKVDVIGAILVIGLVLAAYAFFWTWLD